MSFRIFSCFDFHMKVLVRTSSPLLALILIQPISFLAMAGDDLSNQFVTVKLAYGASIDIPRSWHVMHGNEMQVIETTVGAAIDLSGYAKVVGGTESLLVSIYPDPRLYAGATVTSTILQGSTRLSVAKLTEDQMRSGEITIRQGMEAFLAQFSARAWAWTPIERVSLGETLVLHLSYLRSSEAGDRRVHLYKFFGTGRIFDIALSTSVANESLNQVVLTRIAKSFKAP